MTKQIMVGNVPVGGGAPVSIQSMCNTFTDDVEATVDVYKRQIPSCPPSASSISILTTPT